LVQLARHRKIAGRAFASVKININRRLRANKKGRE
jgi:hypothetical protein